MIFAVDRDDAVEPFPGAPGPDAGSGRPPRTSLPHLARSIMTIVLGGYLLLGVITLYISRPDYLDFAIEATFVLGLFGFQYAHASKAALRWRRRRKTLSLCAQAFCTFFPLLAFHQSWGGGAGFLAGSCLLLVDGWTAWVLFAVPTTIVLFYLMHCRVPWDLIVAYTASTFLTGLVVYGMSRLSTMVEEVLSAREELARMAVNHERRRIASDLHDLLGYSLSAITLKGELTRRLIDEHPKRALAEIHSVLEISRQALADIRTVAHGYRDMSLATEASSAQAMLAAADIRATVSIECGPLGKRLDTVLASALREGVTNMLRHGDVRTCSITAVEDEDGAVRLEVVNDGVRVPEGQTPEQAGAAGLGLGLESISQRVATVGGTVATGITPDGRFHLVVSVLGDASARSP